MGKKLSLDCVDLKLRIQEKIFRRTRRLSVEEIRLKNEDNLATSESSFARWWRSLPVSPTEERIRRERSAKKHRKTA